MSLIGIMPKRTRMEWTRNEDGTFTMIHKEWFNEEDYQKTKKATRFVAESAIRKFGLDSQVSMDDQDFSMKVTYNQIPPIALISAINGELCPQCLKTHEDYLRLIASIIFVSPIGPVVGKAATSIQEVVSEIGEKVYELTPEEQKQLSTLLAKVLRQRNNHEQS